MYTNFRETLDEQLNNPEFAEAWESLASMRELQWQALFAEGLQQALDSGFDGLKAQARAEDYADGSIDAREFFTFNMLELGYNLEEIADMVELPLEWVQTLAKADRSKILNVLSLNKFLDDPESYIDAIKNSMRPTLIREPDGNEVVALGWEQYQNLLCEADVLGGLQMQCDFKNCRLWVDGRCMDTYEREKCPLIVARSELQALHYEFQNSRTKTKRL